MIEKIILGTTKLDLYKSFLESFKDYSNIEILHCDEDKFYNLPELDIIHYYGIARDILGGNLGFNESQIMTTKRKIGIPKYIAVSPAFRKNEFQELEMLKLQMTIPLKSAIDFSSKKEEIKCYGVHTNILSKDDLLIMKNIENIKKWLLELLRKYNITQ